MSPSQFRHHHHHDDTGLHRQQQQQQQRLVINDVNCLRKSGTPLPLKINKESHQIHKSSSLSLTSSATSSINGVINMSSSKNHQQQQQQRHPVIIYTHSPKVIHTQARDFMALVQKLTGLSHADQQQNQSGGDPIDTKQSVSSNGINKFNNNGSSNNLRGGDDTGSSSVVTTDENCGGGGGGGGGFGSNMHQVSLSGSMDPINNNNNPYITDIPIFTPNSLEFPYITRSFYSRYPSPMIFPPTGNSAEITKPGY